MAQIIGSVGIKGDRTQSSVQFLILYALDEILQMADFLHFCQD
ncbi:hypothetical protein [Oscillatoria acuminata]|nr:hypothetical protein [Oscillatoria acuminata]